MMLKIEDLPAGGVGPQCYDACYYEEDDGHDQCPGHLVFFQCVCPCHVDNDERNR